MSQPWARPITISINALSTAADILIAGSLCYMLHRARTGFKKSDSMINKLMLFVVNTGVLTSMCAVASLVCLIASPLTLAYATFYFCIGRLYTNSFLATLNARKAITGKTDDVSHMLVSMPPTLLSSYQTAKVTQQSMSIKVETTQEHHRYDHGQSADDLRGQLKGDDDDVDFKGDLTRRSGPITKTLNLHKEDA
ncbi:hypothetical protein H0H93_011957 [Arthromyces matolae]|nr:hypothetical protein H0H93_011957 [Arthromyces matolae]